MPCAVVPQPSGHVQTSAAQWCSSGLQWDRLLYSYLISHERGEHPEGGATKVLIMFTWQYTKFVCERLPRLSGHAAGRCFTRVQRDAPMPRRTEPPTSHAYGSSQRSLRPHFLYNTYPVSDPESISGMLSLSASMPSRTGTSRPFGTTSTCGPEEDSGPTILPS